MHFTKCIESLGTGDSDDDDSEGSEGEGEQEPPRALVAAMLAAFHSQIEKGQLLKLFPYSVVPLLKQLNATLAKIG